MANFQERDNAKVSIINQYNREQGVEAFLDIPHHQNPCIRTTRVSFTKIYIDR